MTAGIDRRLTTILCADVAGYSGLMERDEEGTLLRLRDHRGRLMRLIGEHRGRIANTSGDGVLAEFPSAIEAVQAAIEVQQELGGLNDALPPEKRMRFRIGINVGDVLHEAGDLFGEGVNVAARLQTLAEPGSILVAGPVHDLVRGRLAVACDFLGERQVRNMERAIPIYRIRFGEAPVGAGAPAAEPPPGGSVELSQRSLLAGVAALLIGGLGLATGQRWLGIIGLVLVWIGLNAALTRSQRQRTWLQSVLLVGLLAGINLLASPERLWFLYPAVPLLALAALNRLGLVRLGRRS